MNKRTADKQKYVNFKSNKSDAAHAVHTQMCALQQLHACTHASTNK